MDEDIYVYYAPLPPGIKESVVPCYNGFTVYLNSNHAREANIEGYYHALFHIQNKDHQKEDVQEIERQAHL